MPSHGRVGVAIQDEAKLMVSTPNEHEPFDSIPFTGSFYFPPDNVDDLWRQLNQATVVYPIESFDYGMREFVILDHNGTSCSLGRKSESLGQLLRLHGLPLRQV